MNPVSDSGGDPSGKSSPDSVKLVSARTVSLSKFLSITPVAHLGRIEPTPTRKIVQLKPSKGRVSQQQGFPWFESWIRYNTTDTSCFTDDPLSLMSMYCFHRPPGRLTPSFAILLVESGGNSESFVPDLKIYHELNGILHQGEVVLSRGRVSNRITVYTFIESSSSWRSMTFQYRIRADGFVPCFESSISAHISCKCSKKECDFALLLS